MQSLGSGRQSGWLRPRQWRNINHTCASHGCAKGAIHGLSTFPAFIYYRFIYLISFFRFFSRRYGSTDYDWGVHWREYIDVARIGHWRHRFESWWLRQDLSTLSFHCSALDCMYIIATKEEPVTCVFITNHGKKVLRLIASNRQGK